jgi:predicted acyl esterase
MWRRPARVALLCALITVACAAVADAASPGLSAQGSAEQVYVTGASPHARVALLGSAGQTVQTKHADSLGGVLFRDVKPGRGYRVRVAPRGAESGPLTVHSDAATPWDPSIYNQKLPTDGYGYLTTRDGTKLAIDVRLPTDIPSQLGVPVHVPNLGQYPTLIEYSGYGYADPSSPQNGIAILANLMGFAVVDVNMRGTGCSGGAYDFFEPLQNLDGYDVVETVAHQPWVMHHKVGMMGISYGGISQLFTAQTDPPDLAAISPLSVIDSTITTLYPGGILNTGFALAWAKERISDTLPASPTGGQRWAYKQIQSGDPTCKANQVLHGEAVNLLGKIHANTHYTPAVADPLDPITFVSKIHVPVFMACQFTDEQTGGHCPDLAEHFTGTQRKWFTFTNGLHIDSLDPETFNRWCDFLQLYVAQEAPITGCALTHVAGPLIYQQAMGINGVSLPSDPIQQQLSYSSALHQFQQLPSIRVLFDNGAGSNPQYPDPGFEQSFSSFPIPGTVARSWYLATAGALGDRRPAHASADKFTWNPHAVPLNDFAVSSNNFTAGGNTGTDGLWTAAPAWKWTQNPPGTAVSFLSAPLTTNTAVIGAGAVHVWIRASKPNVDLQATITEVRPDGKETFVQNGWLRANERELDTGKSTLLQPVLSLRAKDVEPLPRNRFVEVTIPLYYEGHVYRAGSRIRLIISAPNGEEPVWSFGRTDPKRHATVAVAFSKRMPSRVILPVVPGVSVPTGLPPCPGLRGEPCRTYQPVANRTATS